jgi:hypothetical protein
MSVGTHHKIGGCITQQLQMKQQQHINLMKLLLEKQQVTLPLGKWMKGNKIQVK